MAFLLEMHLEKYIINVSDELMLKNHKEMILKST